MKISMRERFKRYFEFEMFFTEKELIEYRKLETKMIYARRARIKRLIRKFNEQQFCEENL